MKASELRIGNFIEQPNGLNQVFSIDAYGGVINTYEQEDIKPIPLTEEWFLKFGFYKDDRGEEDSVCRFDISGKFMFSFHLMPDGKINTWYNNEYPEHGVVKFVHQLQNIYFALTGEELEIKS